MTAPTPFTPLFDTLVQQHGITTAAVYGAMWPYAHIDTTTTQNKPPECSSGLLLMTNNEPYGASLFNFFAPNCHTITATSVMVSPKNSNPPISVSKVGKRKLDQLNMVWNIKVAKMLRLVLL